MKMSEFTTKSFLGNAGAAENSYILINYEDNTTQRPVTYKASLQEIGKAIANDQKLYKKTQNGAVTTDVSQGAYVNGAAEVFASTGAVTAAVSGLASTGYVTAAVANAGGNNGFTNDGDIPVYVGASDGDLKWYNWADPDNCTPYNVISTNGKYFVTFDASKSKFGYFSDISAAELTSIPLGDQTDLHGYVQAASSLPGQYRLQFLEEGEQSPVDVTASMVGAASTGDLSGLASTGYVTAAVSGLASTGYVTRTINTATEGQHLVKVDTQSSYLKYYSSSNLLGTVTSGMISGAASTGYVDAAISDLASTGYVTSAIANKASTSDVVAAVTGLASTGYVTNAVSGLASTGYVTAAVTNAGSGSFDPTEAVTCEVYLNPNDSDSQSWSLYPVMVAPSTDEIFTYDRGEKGYFPRAFVSNGLMTNAISTATNGLASTGYVDTALNNILYYTTDTSNNIWLQDKGGNSLIVFRYNQANDTYTPEATHN